MMLQFYWIGLVVIGIQISSTPAVLVQGFYDQYYKCDPHALDALNYICHITLLPGMHNAYTYWEQRYQPEALICDACSVYTFPNKFYPQFKMLKTIDFSKSHMVQLQLTSISVKPIMLRTLDVSRNEIETLDGTSMFQYAPSLEHLDLSYNKIYEVATTTFDCRRLPSLLQLDLSFNAIASLEATTFSKLPKLLNLKLDHNQLVNVIHIFDELVLLNNLDLSFNMIVDLDTDTFAKMYNLKMLNVSSNSLVAFNTDNLIRSNPRLVSLSVNHNHLTDLQAVNAMNLRHLQAVGNRIVAVHLVGLPSLEVIDLSSNHLNAHDFITIGLGQLRALNLAHNNLTSIRKITSTMSPKVQVLDLSYNQIADLDEASFSSLTGIQVLNLERSGITTIDSTTFSAQTNLTFLDVSFNNLYAFELSMLGRQPQLAELLLDGNRLHDIGLNGFNVTESFPKLKSIGISNNAWECSKLSSMLTQLYDGGVQINVEDPVGKEGGTHMAGVGCKNEMGTTELVPVEERTFAINRQNHIDDVEKKVISSHLVTEVNNPMKETTVDKAIVTCNCNEFNVDKSTRSDDQQDTCTVLTQRLLGTPPRNTFLWSTVVLMGALNVALIGTSIWLYRRIQTHMPCRCRFNSSLVDL